MCVLFLQGTTKRMYKLSKLKSQEQKTWPALLLSSTQDKKVPVTPEHGYYNIFSKFCIARNESISY